MVGLVGQEGRVEAAGSDVGSGPIGRWPGSEAG